MKRNLLLGLCWLLLWPTCGLAAQACSEDYLATTPTENFRDEGDGTVLSLNSGLVWMRCSLGQHWDGKSCQGQARAMTWVEALQAAKTETAAGFKDWRLPNKNELESLVELSCSSPAINQALFPQTPAAFFWTSSPYSGVGDGSWSIDFAYGSVVASVKTGKNFVRLLRER